MTRLSRSAAVRLIDQALHSQALHALLLMNTMFVIVHLFVATSPNEDAWPWARYLRIDHDRSLSEWFETAQLTSAMLFLVAYYRRSNRSIFLSLAILIAVMIVDNILELRLHLGHWLYHGNSGVGELLVVAIPAPLLAYAIYVQYRHADEQQQSELAAMFLVLAIFASFAVVADFVPEIAIGFSSTVYGFWSLIEDGGELMTVSLFAVVVWKATRQPLVQPMVVPTTARASLRS